MNPAVLEKFQLGLEGLYFTDMCNFQKKVNIIFLKKKLMEGIILSFDEEMEYFDVSRKKLETLVGTLNLKNKIQKVTYRQKAEVTWRVPDFN